MIALPMVGVVIGFVLVYRYLPAIPPGWADYVALAMLAGVDALVGGLRASVERGFDQAIFVSGFFANMAIAGLLAYFGDKLGVDLYLAVVVALGIRIFTNLGRTRALLVTARAQRTRARAATAGN